jgi:hypothetical protein
MLNTKALGSLRSDFDLIPGTNDCRYCLLLAVIAQLDKAWRCEGCKSNFTGMIKGKIEEEGKVTSTLNREHRAGFRCEPLPEADQYVQAFTLPLIDVVDLLIRCRRSF